MIGLSDAFVMTIIFSTITARHVIKGFAEEPWMFYLGSFVDVLGMYAFSMMKAMATVCVPPHEIGKINAVEAAIEALMPTPIGQMYASLWGVIFFSPNYLLILHIESVFLKRFE